MPLNLSAFTPIGTKSRLNLSAFGKRTLFEKEVPEAKKIVTVGAFPKRRIPTIGLRPPSIERRTTTPAIFKRPEPKKPEDVFKIELSVEETQRLRETGKIDKPQEELSLFRLFLTRPIGDAISESIKISRRRGRVREVERERSIKRIGDLLVSRQTKKRLISLGALTSQVGTTSFVEKKIEELEKEVPEARELVLALKAPQLLLPFTGIRVVSTKQAQFIIARALRSKITRQDLIDITRGTMKDKAKLEAFKFMSADPVLKPELIKIAKNQKISPAKKLVDYFRENIIVSKVAPTKAPILQLPGLPPIKPTVGIKVPFRKAPIVAKPLVAIKPKITIRAIPKELEPLAVEARKFKSAEEFQNIFVNSIRPRLQKALPRAHDVDTGLAPSFTKSFPRSLKEAMKPGFEERAILLTPEWTGKVLTEMSGLNLEKTLSRIERGLSITKKTSPTLQDFYTQATKGVRAKPLKVPFKPVVKERGILDILKEERLKIARKPVERELKPLIEEKPFIPKDLEPLERQALKFNTAEEFIEAQSSGGKILKLNDIVPDDALSIIDKRVSDLTGTGLPERLYKGFDGVTVGELADVIGKLGIEDDVFRESTIALRKVGYRRIGDIVLTEDGMKTIPQLQEVFNQATKKVEELLGPKPKIPFETVSGYDNFINLNKIKVKNIPFQDMDMAELVRGVSGERILPAIRRSGFFATKKIQTVPIRDLFSQTLSPHLMALKQDGTKLGGPFGEVFKRIWKPTEKSIRVEKEFNTKTIKQIRDLGDKHNIKTDNKSLERLSDVIERVPVTHKVRGENVFRPIEPTAAEAAYIKELRALLDDLRNQANIVRKKLGKDQMGFIQNYIPHMQRTTLWNDLINNTATISDSLDFIIPNQARNPFAFKRLLEEMPDAERNLYILLDRYIGAIGKDIYLTPSIENIKAYNNVLKNRGLNKSAKYWDEYIREGLIGKQHKLDSALNVNKVQRRILQKWNNSVNLAFLTGKIAWNIATQPLSYIMNVPMETASLITPVKAIIKSFNKGLRQYVKENSDVLSIKSTDVRAIAIGEGRNIQNRIYRTKINKYNDFISMIGSVLERELTLTSYIAGLERAKQLGLTGEEALWHADLTAARTQSMYNKENRALILNSDIARAAFPFQSFSIEMYNHAKEIISKSGGALQLTYRQRLGKLFYLLVGIYLSSLYSQALTGRKKTTVGTFIPFLGEYVDRLIDKAFGNQYLGGRSPVTVIQIGEDIIQGSKDFINHGDLKRLRKVAINFGLALFGIGGGGQINNIIDGLMADIEGDVKNVKGDTLFEVDDALSQVKAPIFGVWSTQEGIDYWQQRDKPTEVERKGGESIEKILKDLGLPALPGAEVPLPELPSLPKLPSFR